MSPQSAEIEPMRVLIACEYSGTVRDAFRALGHDAMSCDLLPTEVPGPHYQGDVFDVIGDGWDLVIAHPPCTDLAVSGARWFAAKAQDGRQAQGLEFVRRLLLADVPRIAVENPRSIISSRLRPADQLIHPWQFGHGEQKETCLWLKNLPTLRPTDIVEGREQRIWRLPPGPDRWRERSRTFPGIAAAMAAQWGALGHVRGVALASALPDGLFDLTSTTLRNSPASTCKHEWSERGSGDDRWQECWLCGITRDVVTSPGVQS